MVGFNTILIAIAVNKTRHLQPAQWAVWEYIAI
jgi:hypothetical protein